MSIYESILQRRTIRKFKQEAVPGVLLEKLVNAARVSPSAANLQPLEYLIVGKKENLEDVFKHLKWAGYIAPEGTPKENEKPAAYIIILVNNKVGSANAAYDLGAAAMAVILAGWEEGLGCCWIKSCDKPGLKQLLKVPADYEVDSVLALGFRAEAPVMEESAENIKYWKDSEGVLHVPKKPAGKITHREKF